MHPRLPTLLPTLLLVLLALPLFTACEPSPVQWSDPQEIDAPPGTARLVIDASGSPRFEPESAYASPGRPDDPTLCPTSLRMARGQSRLFAAWWSVRPDSSAWLEAAWSRDSGRTWSQAIPVDTVDVSVRGCKRPPPAIAAVGDDLHVAYAMAAPEGTGVFFAHYMDGLVHSPVAVIYGERLVPTAIAAAGNRVAVAYEEPNGKRRRIDVALSATQGHLFEWHGIASRDVDAATEPSIAITGSRLAVAWVTHGETGPPVHVVRTGRLP